jgi:protein TonB
MPRRTSSGAWKKQIVTRLNASKRFPPGAMGQSGVAKVGFVLDRSGKLISRELMQSSGFSALDTEALATVDRAQPFPVAPPEIGDDTQKLAVPIVFKRLPSQVLDIIKEEATVNAKMHSICRGC